MDLRVYEGLFQFNQGLDQALRSLDILEKSLLESPSCITKIRVNLSELRPHANNHFASKIAQKEQAEENNFYRVRRNREKAEEDPNEIYLELKSREELRRQQGLPPRAVILPWTLADDDRILAMQKAASSSLPTQPEQPRSIRDSQQENPKGGTPTMPKGGFGNLIALPLQKGPREQGNSVFLNELFEPHANQWKFLESVQRVKIDELAGLIHEATPEGNTLGVHLSLPEGDDGELPWLWSPSRSRKEKRITDPLPPTVRLITSNLVYVEKKGLPSSMQDRLIRIAAFQNPEFYKAQTMRLSTYGKPRVISCSESFPEHIGLPRGCLEEVVSLFKGHGVKIEIQDERTTGQKIDVSFRAELRADQNDAVRQLLAYDEGILCAPTAFGKTVIGACLIARRGVSTLILVHRRQLMDQWREQLAAFLALPIGNIGQIGGGKCKRTGMIDVAVIQSLQRQGVVHDFVAEYGHVIVDECHHLSAFTFERVLREIKAKYVLGLTATPTRKDGHHPIIYMQCGSIRFYLSPKKAAQSSPFQHTVIPRFTDFAWERSEQETMIHDIYSALVTDQQRNDLIVKDMQQVLSDGRSPLVLTSRKEHLDYLAGRLHGICQHIFVLKGGMGAKQRKQVAESLSLVSPDEPRIILATGSYLGEGFDDARLDTLFLAMPISWRGTLQQYVGRLHRLHENKKEVLVYD